MITGINIEIVIWNPLGVEDSRRIMSQSSGPWTWSRLACRPVTFRLTSKTENLYFLLVVVFHFTCNPFLFYHLRWNNYRIWWICTSLYRCRRACENSMVTLTVSCSIALTCTVTQSCKKIKLLIIIIYLCLYYRLRTINDHVDRMFCDDYRDQTSHAWDSSAKLCSGCS